MRTTNRRKEKKNIRNEQSWIDAIQSIDAKLSVDSSVIKLFIWWWFRRIMITAAGQRTTMNLKFALWKLSFQPLRHNDNGELVVVKLSLCLIWFSVWFKCAKLYSTFGTWSVNFLAKSQIEKLFKCFNQHVAVFFKSVWPNNKYKKFSAIFVYFMLMTFVMKKKRSCNWFLFCCSFIIWNVKAS